MNSRILFAILFVVLICHLRYAKPQFRIRNGENIPIAQSPHLVAIFIYTDYICVGSLVHMKLVVTVAHCVKERVQEGLVVLAGVADIREINTRRGQRRRVAHIYLPRDYDSQTGFMDIAVLKVHRPFNRNNEIQSISLYEGEVTQGLMVRICAWGAVTADGIVPSYLLQTAELPLVEMELCRHIYANKLVPVILPETLICAGCSRSDVCNGDSGAAALVKGQLFAVVQGGCDHPAIPSLLTNVTDERVRNVISYAKNCNGISP